MALVQLLPGGSRAETGPGQYSEHGSLACPGFSPSWIAVALGWLAELAANELALVKQQKLICCDAPEDTARHYKQMLVDFMRMPPTRSDT